MNILVTGGAGFIGSHLVDRLTTVESNRVTVLDNLYRGKEENLANCRHRIVLIKGDIRDQRTVEKAMDDVDIVYHLAAQSNVLGAVSDPEYSFNTNVAGSLHVFNAAKRAGTKRLVFASSREVYGEPSSLPVDENKPLNPKNAYGASKAACELYARTLCSSTLEIRTVRLTNVYGPRDFNRVIPIFAASAKKGNPITIFGGSQIIDFVPINHVVEALIRAATVDLWPGPINIGSGKPTTLQALAKRIIALAESSSKLVTAPAREVEVAHFLATTGLQETYLQLKSPEDPLHDLESCLSYLETCTNPETLLQNSQSQQQLLHQAQQQTPTDISQSLVAAQVSKSGAKACI